MPKSKKPRTDLIYETASRFKNGPLRQGTSLFGGDGEIWRGETVEAVHDRLAGDPATPAAPASEELADRLDGASDDAIVLTAELAYIHLLVEDPETLDGGAKHRLLQSLLALADQSPAIPDLMDMALDVGLAQPSDGSAISRYWPVRYLAEFALKWSRCPQPVRESLLDETWAFRDFAFNLDTEKSLSQRHALLHLLFPQTFEPIFSESTKQFIVQRFGEFADEAATNVDQQLIQVRDGLTQKLGHGFDSFYDDKIRWQWQSDDWETLVEVTDAVYGWESFDERARRPIVAIAEALSEARQRMLTGDSDYTEGIQRALSRSESVVDASLADNFERWVDQDPDRADAALSRLWAEEGSAYERIGGFCQFAPDELGRGPASRLRMASLLLLGVELGPYPVYDYGWFHQLLGAVDYPEPADRHPMEVYRHFLSFLDTLLEELAGRGIALRDRVDAEALARLVVRTRPGEFNHLDPGTRRRLGQLFGQQTRRTRKVWALRPDQSVDVDTWCADGLDGEDWSFTVTQYADVIAPGDIALVVRSDDTPAIVAAGEVTDEPRPLGQEEHPPDDRTAAQITVAPKAILQEPLDEQALTDDPVLRRMRLVSEPRTTDVPVRASHWRRIMAHRPTLAVDATAADVGLDRFFRRYFNDRREADHFYGVLEEVVVKMNASGRTDRRFSLRTDGGSDMRLSLYFHDREMVAMRGVGHEGTRILLTLDATIAEEMGLTAVTDWPDGSEEYDARFYEVPVPKARQLRDRLGRAFDRGMKATLTEYADWSQGPHRSSSSRMEEAFAAVFSRSYRRRLFNEGFPEESESETTGLEALTDDLFLPDGRFDEMVALLRRRKNLVLQGPPGVGKSLIAGRLASALVGQPAGEQITRVQFHPSFSYRDFVHDPRADRPESGGRRGIFYRFCRLAEHDPEGDYVFIIEQIDRGDPASIFGELVTLLDPAERGSDHAIHLRGAPSDEETFHVPPNVHLLGTMSPALAPSDFDDQTLRRRFAFADIEPAFKTDAFRSYLADRGVAERVGDRIAEGMARLNETIARESPRLGPGYRLGHGYFCRRTAEEDDLGEAWLRRIVRYDIAPQLHQYWPQSPERADRAVEALLEGLA
jgi:hypothetical protein